MSNPVSSTRASAVRALALLPACAALCGAAFASGGAPAPEATDPGAEWAEALAVQPGSVDRDPILQPAAVYRYLCRASTRSFSTEYLHSANQIGQAQFRVLAKCRAGADERGYYPGYCRLEGCTSRW